MLKKIVLITSMIGLALVNNSYSQDPHYTQFYANPLYLNPAFAGTAICPRTIMNYRNQWPSISGSYVTYNASYDQYFESISGGLGLLFNTDKAGEGVLTTDNISAIYSYHLPVSHKFSVNAGFQASYFWKRLDWYKLSFGDQIDPRDGFVWNTKESFGKNKINDLDFSTGVLAYSDNFFIGFAAHHITTPNESFYEGSLSELPVKYTVHTGMTFNLTRRGTSKRIGDPTISPNILYQQQQDFQQLNYGMYINKSPLVGGIWFRQNFRNADALILLIGLQTGVMKFGYSYDVTISRLKSSSGGSHEFSITYQFNCPPKKKKIRIINCPSF